MKTVKPRGNRISTFQAAGEEPEGFALYSVFKEALSYEGAIWVATRDFQGSSLFQGRSFFIILKICVVGRGLDFGGKKVEGFG